jgi:hypothetical protein
MAQPHPIPLPAALLLATAALGCAVAAACAFLLVALVLVAGHGAVALHDGAWAAWCIAGASACGTVAALIALTRTSGGVRPLALGAVWALAFAWPLSGLTPAAVAATVLTGFVVRWGTSSAPARPAGGPAAAALTVVALALLGVAFGGAPAAAPADAARPGAARVGAADEARAGENGAAEARPRGSSGARAASPAALVRAYYRALDRRDFKRAWRLLSPAVRTEFGGFAHWQAGFATTLSSRPTRLRVRGDAVELLLVARDRAACGVLVQRFAVSWRLRGTSAIAVGARRVGAPACAAT